MYPAQELTRLAAHRVSLRRHIGRNRAECRTATARVAQPVVWLDRTVMAWRRFSPLARFAVLPIGFLLRRTIFRRRNLLRGLVRWGPLLLGAIRVFTRGR